MKSVFRIYAKANKGNDTYLYNELISFGIKPQYQQLLHSFYFNADFNQMFKLSFQSFTAESMYVQLGHKYPLKIGTGDTQTSIGQYFRKINFKNYFHLDRGIIENISLKVLARQSSQHLPSDNAICSIFQNHLHKEIVLKQYRKMVRNQYLNDTQNNRLENYYDIKEIVSKKWEYQDAIKQQQMLLLQNNEKNKQQQTKLIGGDQQKENMSKLAKTTNNRQQQQKQMSILNNISPSYQPYLILYIRRNHARMLLKLNRQPMYKFGWKKNTGWAPIRETLASSILYRTGLIQQFKKNNTLNLWDPFCGSATIPLVTLAILTNLKIRQDFMSNFVWHYWPVYNKKYLDEYTKKAQQQVSNLKINIFATDIDISSVRNTINNFKQLIATNSNAKYGQVSNKGSQINETHFLKINPADQIFQIAPNSIYAGCGDFQQMIKKINKNTSKQGQKINKINIVTNLPYLGQRSKQHHPIKQLISIYRRFGQMISQNKQLIDNVFVIVDNDIKNRNHFINNSQVKWRILDNFSNGGIEVCLLGWEGNRVGWRQMQIYRETKNGDMVNYQQQRSTNLQQYRTKIKQIEKTKYQLPSYLAKYRNLRGSKRVMQKRKARQLRAAYAIFVKNKDKNQTYQIYARKNLALRLSQRGSIWRRKNISMLGKNIKQKQQIIKNQFQNRIQQALKRSEQLKQRKNKGGNKAIKRKW